MRLRNRSASSSIGLAVARLAPRRRRRRAALTPAQLDEVRAMAYRKARDLRLAESTSRNLAEAATGALASRAE